MQLCPESRFWTNPSDAPPAGEPTAGPQVISVTVGPNNRGSDRQGVEPQLRVDNDIRHWWVQNFTNSLGEAGASKMYFLVRLIFSVMYISTSFGTRWNFPRDFPFVQDSVGGLINPDFA
jgi:hypothetical protein